jgi:hypothetical protein
LIFRKRLILATADAEYHNRIKMFPDRAIFPQRVEQRDRGNFRDNQRNWSHLRGRMTLSLRVWEMGQVKNYSQVQNATRPKGKLKIVC